MLSRTLYNFIARWRLDFLGIGLAFAALLYILPNTPFSALVAHGCLLLLNLLETEGVEETALCFIAGGFLLTGLLIRYVHERLFCGTLSSHVTAVADAVSLLSVLYLLDFLLSTAKPYHIDHCWWPFFALSPFFLALLFLTGYQALRLSRILVALISLQGIYAISYYVIGQHQFYTPFFGNRTGGTFYQPNGLYPLLLIGIPLALTLGTAQSVSWRRYLFFIAAAINLLALILTYMRSGWLALSVAGLYLLHSRSSSITARPIWRILGIAMIICLLAGVLLVRTQGRFIGNPRDRSTLGRFAIWQVSLHAIARHPLLGSGLGTYEVAQTEEITPALRSFHPQNVEAKSLPLNFAAEFGLLGLGLLILLVWRSMRYFREALDAVPQDSEEAAVLTGTRSGLCALLIAGLTDTPILHEERAAATFVLALMLGVAAVFGRDALPVSELAAETLRLQTRRLRQIEKTVLAFSLVVFCWILGATIRQILSAQPYLNPLLLRLPLKQQEDSLKMLPGTLQDCLVSTADAKFYTHAGVDWEGLHCTLRKDCREGSLSLGNSTITMQIVRYRLIDSHRGLSSKLAEIILALYLEHHLSKTSLLRLYADNVDFGMNAAGFMAAAHVYFNKRPQDLTLGECAFLAGILLKKPETIEELTPALIQSSRQRGLQRLEAVFPDRYTSQQLQQARQEPIVFAWENPR